MEVEGGGSGGIKFEVEVEGDGGGNKSEVEVEDGGGGGIIFEVEVEGGGGGIIFEVEVAVEASSLKWSGVEWSGGALCACARMLKLRMRMKFEWTQSSDWSRLILRLGLLLF